MEKDNNAEVIWQEYEKIKQYNQIKGMYEETKQNYNFYYGNHWEGVKTGNIEPIKKNLIKLVVKDKMSRILNHQLEPIFINKTYEEGLRDAGDRAVKLLTDLAQKIWEMEKIYNKGIEALKDSCINSEGLLYLYMLDNEIKVELLDKVNVFYSNEENDVIEEQDFIIIRQIVDKNNLMKLYPDLTKEDFEMQDSEDSAVDGRSINPLSEFNTIKEIVVLTKFYKKEDTVWYIKSIKGKIIEEAKNTGLRMFPIIHMLWEKKKNDARGIGLVAPNIPNQIEYNKNLFKNALIQSMYAYPKPVINKRYVKNASSLMRVGEAILVEDSDNLVDDVKKMVTYLQPAPVSIDTYRSLQYLEDGLREAESTGDLATANVNPERASGRAILAVQNESNQILNEQVEHYKLFVETIARVLLDMWRTYFKSGLEIYNEELGQVEKIEKELLEALSIDVIIEVTPKSPYDINLHNQAIDNLLMSGLIELEEWVEALDENAPINKKALKKLIEERKKKQQQIMEMQEMVNRQNQEVEGQLRMEEELSGMLGEQVLNLENQEMDAMEGLLSEV